MSPHARTRATTAAVWALAIILWGAVIIADAANLPDRIWVCLLVGAAMATQAAFRQSGYARQARSSDALAAAMVSRPMYRDPTGPIPVVPEQLAVPVYDGHTRRGRHVTRAR